MILDWWRNLTSKDRQTLAHSNKEVGVRYEFCSGDVKRG